MQIIGEAEIETIRHLANKVIENIIGWAGASGQSLPFVGSAVYLAGRGNHLEIGTSFGASAIMAALVKKQYGLGGLVFCVDPMEYERHEPCVTRAGTITKEIADYMPEIFADNLDKFGVSDMVVFVRKPSFPFPDELSDIEFSSAFIDGWHYGDAPTIDAMTCAEMVTDVIVLDDCVPYYPDVMRSFAYMCSNRQWKITCFSQRAGIFQRNTDNIDIFYETCGYKTSSSLQEWIKCKQSA